MFSQRKTPPAGDFWLGLDPPPPQGWNVPSEVPTMVQFPWNWGHHPRPQQGGGWSTAAAPGIAGKVWNSRDLCRASVALGPGLQGSGNLWNCDSQRPCPAPQMCCPASCLHGDGLWAWKQPKVTQEKSHIEREQRGDGEKIGFGRSSAQIWGIWESSACLWRLWVFVYVPLWSVTYKINSL